MLMPLGAETRAKVNIWLLTGSIAVLVQVMMSACATLPIQSIAIVISRQGSLVFINFLIVSI
jgi:hypothetical protein